MDIFDSVGVPVSDGASDLDADTTWSIFGGYRFSPYLAVEAGYVDLGTAKYRASGTVDPIVGAPSLPATFNADFESKGITVAGIASAPLGEMFDIHARLGVLFADSEVKLSSTVGTGRAAESVSGNSQDLFYGVGAAVHFGGNWSVSLDWQQYKDVGKEDETGETDVDTIALGISYRLLAIDAVVQTELVDADRIFVMGHSFGGFAACALVTQTSRFKAAIASAPITDWVSFYNAFAPTERYSDHGHESPWISGRGRWPGSMNSEISRGMPRGA